MCLALSYLYNNLTCTSHHYIYYDLGNVHRIAKYFGVKIPNDVSCINVWLLKNHGVLLTYNVQWICEIIIYIYIQRRFMHISRDFLDYSWNWT